MRKDIDLKLGADPEVFVVLKEGRVPVSAHGLIPGDKKNPFRVSRGAVQVDGMAAEFNILPAESSEEWVENIESVMSDLRSMLPDTHDLEISPCVTFSKEVWDSTPKEAKILGCEPDMCAYTGAHNPPPNGEVDFRTAAGHIHFGWCEGMDISSRGHLNACIALAKELDYTLGYPSSVADFSPEAVKRRVLYGRPGAFRPKPYGMEYRTLSNFWIKSPELMRWVYEVCINTFYRLLSGEGRHQPEDSPLGMVGRAFSQNFSITELDIYTTKLLFPPGVGAYLEKRREYMLHNGLSTGGYTCYGIPLHFPNELLVVGQ